MIDLTCKIPVVNVPVLSKATVLASDSFSIVVPFLTKRPLRELRLIPPTKAIGAAKMSGQGLATTKTSAKRVISPEMNQAAPAISRDTMVKGTA